MLGTLYTRDGGGLTKYVNRAHGIRKAYLIKAKTSFLPRRIQLDLRHARQ